MSETLAERIADKLSAEINRNIHYASKGSVAWNLLVLPAINEALEEAAKVAEGSIGATRHEIAAEIRKLRGTP